MAAEWLNGVYTRMWEEPDDRWNFDELPGDWSVWDEPPGADRSLNDFGPYDFSSSTVGDDLPDFTPPRPRDLQDGHEQIPQTHDNFGSTSLPPMGNTSSTANSRPSHSEQITAPPAPAQVQQPTNSQRRSLAAGHSDDWLDRGTQAGRTSFGYIPDHLFERLSASPEPEHTSLHSAPEQSADTQNASDMPATTRRRQRGSIVDLTTLNSSPQLPAQRAPKSLKRTAQDAEEGRSTKRAKRSPQNIEELDFTAEAPSAEDELRQAQQEKAIAAQQAEQESSGPLKIGKRQCIICMENYTNATVTHCGHIYCHECLTQALKAGEQNSDRGVGNCPVCRKPINRKKGTQMIPLAFMKKSAFKGKARKDMGVLG